MEHGESTIKNIHALFWKSIHLMEEYEAVEIYNFLEEVKKAGLIDQRKNITEIHVISCIGENEPLNITMIAEKMKLSKASISKISGKLQEEGFIKKIQLNDNQKEVYFRLTPKGKKLFMLHEDLHRKGENEFFLFLQKYSQDELVFIKKLCQDVTDDLEKRLITNSLPSKKSP